MKVLFDGLLSVPKPLGVNVFGYADDGAVVVEAESRQRVVSVADSALAAAAERALRNKLCFSVAKTEAIIFMGPYERPPLIRLGYTIC